MRCLAALGTLEAVAFTGLFAAWTPHLRSWRVIVAGMTRQLMAPFTSAGASCQGVVRAEPSWVDTASFWVTIRTEVARGNTWTVNSVHHYEPLSQGGSSAARRVRDQIGGNLATAESSATRSTPPVASAHGNAMGKTA